MIAQIEAALVRLISGCLGDEVDVATGPGDWDDSYIRNLLTDLPAVRIVFDGGVQEQPETFILMDSRWVVFIAVGWKGQDEASRRTGAAGAFTFLDVLVPALHKAQPTDSNGKKFTLVEVESVENLWTASLQAVGVALYAISLNVQIEFNLDPAISKGRLDDFLKAALNSRFPTIPTPTCPMAISLCPSDFPTSDRLRRAHSGEGLSPPLFGALRGQDGPPPALNDGQP